MYAAKFLVPLSISTALLTPHQASAQTARERDLEARIQLLENAIQSLQQRMGVPANAPISVEAAHPMVPAATAPMAVGTPPTVAAPSAVALAKPADGFRSGNTQIKVGGFVRVNMIGSRSHDGEMPVGALGREFYLPQQIPVGGNYASDSLLLSARQTRLAVSTATPTAHGDIKTHVEFDFALAAAPTGAQRATNPYTPTFRRGFIQYGGLLIGQEWTTFQNFAVLPETTDFVGPMDGTVFVRQGVIQYKMPLSKSLDLLVAVENPETETVNLATPSVTDNDDDRMPDLVARINARTKFGEFSLAGIARELRAQTGGSADSLFGWGVSAAGRVAFGPDKRHDIRFMGTYGQGIGRYLGLGFAPDAVMLPGADVRLARVDNLAAFGALKLGWTKALRSTFTYSFQDAYYPTGVLGVPGAANAGSETLAGNLFWTPIEKFDFGVEYRRGHRELANGARGTMDRLEFAAKYGF